MVIRDRYKHRSWPAANNGRGACRRQELLAKLKRLCPSWPRLSRAPSLGQTQLEPAIVLEFSEAYALASSPPRMRRDLSFSASELAHREEREMRWMQMQLRHHWGSA